LPGLCPDVDGQLKPARSLPRGGAGLDGLVPGLACLPRKARERDAARIGQQQQDHDHEDRQPRGGAVRRSEHGPGSDDHPQRAEVADEPERRLVAEAPPGVGVEFLDGAPGGNQLARMLVATPHGGKTTAERPAPPPGRVPGIGRPSPGSGRSQPLASAGTGARDSWAALWRAAARRGSSKVAAAAAATRTAFTDMATTIAVTNAPVEGAVPSAL